MIVGQMIVGETFVGEMTLSVKWLCRWNNRRRNVCRRNDPVGEVFVGEMNVGETYVGEMNRTRIRYNSFARSLEH